MSIIDTADKTVFNIKWYWWIVFGAAVVGGTAFALWYNDTQQPLIGFEPGSGAGYWFYATVVVLGIWLFISFFRSPGRSTSALLAEL